MTLLTLNGLSKHYGKLRAADDLSFSVERGEIFGLLGKNGAGKTTTLRTLATMLTPTSGSATICGADLTTQPETVRAHVGLLFGGDTGLYDRMTAGENIVYFARLNDMTEAQAIARAEELSRLFHFEEFLNIRAGKLSKGTRQKAAFARAIVHNPDVMLFDEPTVGLDVTARRDAEEFILSCKREGKCIILSDHILSVVERLCDRVGIMDGGRLIDMGTIPALTARHGAATLEDVFFKLAGDRT